jgi:hypothetical protein
MDENSEGINVRCCKDGNEKIKMIEYGCDETKDSQCSPCRNKKFKEADAICKSHGFRLCSINEIEDNKTKGTGCGFDLVRVWATPRTDAAEPSKPAAKPNKPCKSHRKEDICEKEDSCVWRDQGPPTSKDRLWKGFPKCKSIIQAGFNMKNFTKDENTLKGSDEDKPGKNYAILGQCLKNCEQDSNCKAIGYSSSKSKAKRCIIMKGDLSNGEETRGGKFYKKK